MRIKELLEQPKAMTITKATTKRGIDRARADRITDPQGWFGQHPRAPGARRNPERSKP